MALFGLLFVGNNSCNRTFFYCCCCCSHRSSMWQNSSPNKNSFDRPSLTTVKTEPTSRSSRTTSEHDESQFDINYIPNSTISSRKSTDDIKSESYDKKHRHHHHHQHHHHKRHKTKHDFSVNGDRYRRKNEYAIFSYIDIFFSLLLVRHLAINIQRLHPCRIWLNSI